MNKFKIILCILCVLCGYAKADTHTAIASGAWVADAATVWDIGAAPADGDTVVIPDAAYNIEFDEDMSGWATGVALSVGAAATLQASDTAGDYYLMTSSDITLNGTLQAGTSVAVPYDPNFEINFNSTAHSIERGVNAQILLYCEQPTIKYVVLDEGEPSGETVLSCDGYDVTGEATYWKAGDTVCIVDSTITDIQYTTIASTTATSITVNDVLDSAISANSIVVLVERNIKISGVAASDYAIRWDNATSTGTSGADYLGCEISNCYRVGYLGYGFEFAGTTKLLTTSPIAFTGSPTGPVKAIFSGSMTGPISGSSSVSNDSRSCIFSGLFAGWSSRMDSGGFSNTLSGRMFACGTNYNATGFILTASGVIDYSTRPFQSCTSPKIYGTIENNVSGILNCTDVLIANTTLGINASYDVGGNITGKCYNVVFGSATEFYQYNDNIRSPVDYFESFNHNQVENAFKAWCRGGIVSSQTTSPPTGYTLWYEHACESADYSCFRQYQTTVLPGTAIEVTGKIRIADAEDLSSNPPMLCIVDYFADPLVDDTKSCLAEDEIPISDGSETGWQDVKVIWANTGDAPRTVLVRMIAYHATADIDEVWSIADYQNQIAALYNSLIPIRTDVAASDSTTSFTLTAGKAAANAYRYNTIAVQDAADGHWEQKKINSWTSGRVVTVENAFSFTPAVGDTAYVLSAGYGAPVDLTSIDNEAIAEEVVRQMDANSADLDTIIEDTETTIPGLIAALVVPDAAGTAASLHAITDALITALNNISQAQVRTQVDDALNAYDPPTKTEMDNGFAALNDITVAEVWDGIVEGTYSYKDFIRLMGSVLFGKASGGGTTNIIFRDTDDITDRIDETVDAMGNRTAVILNPD